MITPNFALISHYLSYFFLQRTTLWYSLAVSQMIFSLWTTASQCVLFRPLLLYSAALTQSWHASRTAWPNSKLQATLITYAICFSSFYK